MQIDQEYFLDSVLPNRLNAISWYECVLKELAKGTHPQEMMIAFDRKIKIVGNSWMLFNPSAEAGVIHCRSLLEFMGLKVSPNNREKLVQRPRGRRKDDIVIEDLSRDGRALAPISLEQAVSAFSGPPELAEQALAATCHWANKVVAHLTAIMPTDPEALRLFQLAAQGVPKLVLRHVYGPLGIPFPDYEVRFVTIEQPIAPQDP